LLSYDELKCESIFTFLDGAITVNSVLVLLSNLHALALVVKSKFKNAVGYNSTAPFDNTKSVVGFYTNPK